MSGGDDLLNQLENILESDSSIDEVGFIHPTQLAALNGEVGAVTLSSSHGPVPESADGTSESELSKANNACNNVFWSGDHKLGISTAVLVPLYKAAKHAFMYTLGKYKTVSSSFMMKDGSASNSHMSVEMLEIQLMKHSRALLLLSCDFGTAWNFRKTIVSKKLDFSMFMDEMLLSTLVLSYSPKSERAWSHRRWVIKMIAGNCSNLQEIIEKESEFVNKIAEKSKMNYRAWNHRCWLVSFMTRREVLHELNKFRSWAGLHVADNSCFHYRARLMLRLLEDPLHDKHSGHGSELHQVWEEELSWTETLIARYVGREALWLHRRFLSSCWIKHFANAGPNMLSNPSSGGIVLCDIHKFMDNELQLFYSCSTILDNDFGDYQAQATYAATYIMWLTRQISTCLGLRPRSALDASELKTLLNNVCPEKAFVWDSLVAIYESM